MPAGDADRETFANLTLGDFCFNVDEMETRHVRLVFENATDPEDLWLGVAAVGFRCANAPTASGAFRL